MAFTNQDTIAFIFLAMLSKPLLITCDVWQQIFDLSKYFAPDDFAVVVLNDVQ
jgi:hypothetical protein